MPKVTIKRRELLQNTAVIAAIAALGIKPVRCSPPKAACSKCAWKPISRYSIPAT